MGLRGSNSTNRLSEQWRLTVGVIQILEEVTKFQCRAWSCHCYLALGTTGSFVGFDHLVVEIAGISIFG